MAFQHQVAGHPASISFSPLSSDGSSLVKPCTPTEYEFYSSTCHTVTREAFAGVWIPEFWGTLKLQPGSVEEAAGRIADASGRIRSEQPDEKEMLVLENLAFPFVHPNILDVKLGRQLYDHEASEEKRIRMERVSRETTSGSDSLRICGFKVWNEVTSSYDIADKSFGKSLAAPQLPAALSQFLPGSHSSPPVSLPPFVSTVLNGHIPSDAAVGEPAERKPPAITSAPPIPLDLLRPLLLSIIYRLKQLIVVLGMVKWRMRGGSVLIIYEGDYQALRKVMERSTSAPSSSNSVTDDEEEDAGSTTSSGSPTSNALKCFDIRLIDFAHTTAAVDADKDAIAGVRRLVDLFAQLLDGLGEEEQEK